MQIAIIAHCQRRVPCVDCGALAGEGCVAAAGATKGDPVPYMHKARREAAKPTDAAIFRALERQECPKCGRALGTFYDHQPHRCPDDPARVSADDAWIAAVREAFERPEDFVAFVRDSKLPKKEPPP